MRRRHSVIGLLTLALVVAGCATSSYRSGDRLLQQEKYQEAAAKLRAAVSEDPDRSEIWLKLGMALYHLQEWDQAMQAFKQASLLDPQDGRNVLYRGMIHEELGEADQARRLYRSYLTLSEDPQLEEEIRYRLRWLEDTRLQRLVSQAIAQEESVDISKIAKNSVAVLRFDAGSLPERLQPLGRGMAELIYHDLSYVEPLRLVERLQLSKLQQELELSQSEFVDKLNSPRVGKIMGAAKIVTGQLEMPAEERLNIGCGIVDVGPGVTEYPAEKQGEIDKFFELQKSLTFDIIEKLGYEITPAIRNRIDSLPTESYLALIAYSRGLDYADSGLYALAEAEFEAALKEDPNFGLAEQALEEYGGLSNYQGSIRSLGTVADMVESDLALAELGQNQKHEIIQRLQQTTRTGVSEQDSPYTTPEIRGGRVIVTGRTDP